MGTFGRLVFCEVKTQIVGKTKFFDSLRLPVSGSLLLLSFRNISERRLDALLDLDFAALNICAILREYRRRHAPCRQLPRRAAAGMSLTIAPGLRTLTAAFRTAQRTGTAYRRSWPVHGRIRPAPRGLHRRCRPANHPSAAQTQGFRPLFRAHRHKARPDG